ncbi:MAG: Wzz/FepE/Etk N-terminal domain-containing protein, partial [Fusobacteriaceae bacterium]
MKRKFETTFRDDIYNDEEELDLMELLMILVNEKKTIFITMGLVTALSFGGALVARNVLKNAEVILTPKLQNFREENFLVKNILEKVYSENNLREKGKITLDEFTEELKTTPIIPESIKNKKEFLFEKGETLIYLPTSYKLSLRVGSIDKSTKILSDYVLELNSYYREKNESNYEFKEFDLAILADEKYNYEDYIKILETRKAALEKLIAGRETSKTDYVAYGFGYREIKIALDNLESVRIEELKNYLLATNIVRNKEKFQSEFINRKFRLENSIKESKESAINYKNLLNTYKVETSNIVVPKGVKITIGQNAKELYYTELMTNYLRTEDTVLKLEEELKEL